MKKRAQRQEVSGESVNPEKRIDDENVSELMLWRKIGHRLMDVDCSFRDDFGSIVEIINDATRLIESGLRGTRPVERSDEHAHTLLDLIVTDVLKKGIDVRIKHVDGKNVYEVNGFYKSNVMCLYVQGNAVIAECRYHEKTEICSFNDLACLNVNWWHRSKDRFDGWSSPDGAWLPTLLDLGLVKAVTVQKYE
jgi:hypothetical protein